VKDEPTADVRAAMIRAQDDVPAPSRIVSEHRGVVVSSPVGTPVRKQHIVSEAFRRALVQVGARGSWSAASDVVRVAPEDRGRAPKK
jgi:hypothetical protein